MTTATTTTTERDRDCAKFARAALFPKRMHRDTAHADHFPALLQLDVIRNELLNTISASSTFPRGVVVVRDLSSDDTAAAASSIQWNGQPHIDPITASFDVIPDILSVKCTTSEIKDDLKHRIAYNETKKHNYYHDNGNTGQPPNREIVLNTDKVLKSDYTGALSSRVAKDLPQQTFTAVEEALAHQLVNVQYQNNNNNNNNIEDIAKMEVQAAKAAECYYSRHKYDDQYQIKKGSKLQNGYSWLMLSSIKQWAMNKCIYNVATTNVKQEHNFDHKEVQDVVKNAMKE